MALTGMSGRVRVIRFGTCVFDLEARQLVRDGQPVRLSPKAFELLNALVTMRPRALSKAELHDRIWPGTFVTDDSLVGLVREVRAAIGDQERPARFLRTIHAFGYGFANIVEESDSDHATATRNPTNCYLVFDGRAVPLAEGENLVGREPSARIMLDSVRVSHRHARITVQSGCATLEDLGSRNGTLLKDQRIDGPVALTDGDVITVGGVVLTYRAPGVPVKTEADSSQ
jgi:DNA-binding winged helix-turn-helix (wHTH) protein